MLLLGEYSTSVRGVPNLHRRQGWKPFEWFFIDEDRSEHFVNGIKAADLRDIHDTLFGQEGDRGLGDRISLRRTAMLILASINIQFCVATKEGDDDGYQSRYHEGNIHLMMENSISPGHIRKICGIAPLQDDSEQ